ncbi:MAG: class I SAM-dependent methyltransferase [Sporichthyaceae bacterium]
MTATVPTLPEADEARRDALVERLFEATIGTLEMFSVHLGSRLGLYTTLRDLGAVTADQLAAKTRLDERYLREWLEQQAVAGILDVDDAAAAQSERRFSLSRAHAAVLADPADPAHVAPFAPMLVGIAGALPAVVDAFRTGAGVPFAAYGPDMREGQAAINRPAFSTEMADWLGSIPAVHARLGLPGARVADLGCGHGWSSLAIARAYPTVTVDGIDLDSASIAAAAPQASAPDVAGRLTFALRDAGSLTDGDPYDLVTIFEALHDMARPVEVLAAARAALAPDGAVLVVDERVADTFTAPGDAVERMMFGWSVSHCLPASRAETPSAALGTALRTSTALDLAAQAGFAQAEVLPIENDFFRFYLLRSASPG